MEIIRRIDEYNANKVWLIKRYKDGHYYLNQEIKGRKFYRRFYRFRKRELQAIFE